MNGYKVVGGSRNYPIEQSEWYVTLPDGTHGLIFTDSTPRLISDIIDLASFSVPHRHMYEASLVIHVDYKGIITILKKRHGKYCKGNSAEIPDILNDLDVTYGINPDFFERMGKAAANKDIMDL